VTVETATYISDLNATYPASGDARSEGDDHLRLLKSTVKATFPNISGAVTPTHTELNYVDGVTSAIQTQLDAKAALTDRATVLITATSASAVAAVDFTSGISSTYEEYELHIINAVPASSAVPWIRTSTDAGATFDSASGDYHYVNARANATTMAVSNGSTTATSMVLTPTTVNTAANQGGVSGIVRFFYPSNTTTPKHFLWAVTTGTGTAIESVNGAGNRSSTADIDAIRFMFSTGNITSGQFKLYGVKK
jgi:hypothetical protein